MLKSTNIAVTTVAFVIFACVAVFAAPVWVDNENATSVLGQANFTTGTGAATAANLYQPSSVRFDPTSGKLFVTDCANYRILRFANAQALVNGGAAEAAFGQPDLNTGTGGGNATQSKIGCAGEVTIDAGGHLWVADTDNSRVLRWDNAATLASGQPANAVLGQPDFTTTFIATTQAKMAYPEGIFVDTAGTLWVADTANNRVLRFDNAASKATGSNADAVLGQIDFLSNSPSMTQSNFAAPNSITGNATGSIWVSDSGNSRVLRFDVASAKANGGTADGIIGSSSYTSIPANHLTRTSLDTPGGVTIDNQNRLYVADAANDRILIYNNATTLPDGSQASNVLGQPNYTDATARLTQSGFDMPYTPSWDSTSGSLWVADLANNRVLRFVPQTPTAGNVSISGRVLDRAGAGLRNAGVSYT
ncbi:MAG: NHL repeat-containing protein, partial [Acidobacteria bacterium]|nr:NHL repeat-containing protein [Acidobacteriota bacterium]